MLVEACLSFLGGDVCIWPTYGWGWRRDGAPLGRIEYAPIDGAHFMVRAERFFHFRGELRGLVGVVTESAHVFSGMHVVAAEMIANEHDFTERLCHRYDLTLGPAMATCDEWPCIEGERVIEGYGIVAASKAHIETFLSRAGTRQ